MMCSGKFYNHEYNRESHLNEKSAYKNAVFKKSIIQEK